MKKIITSILNPNNLNDVLGQKHLIGKNKLLTKMVENSQLYSLILFGPPGCGKTWTAKALCNSLNLEYKTYNPSIDDKSTLQEIIKNNHKKLVIIIDEIHRMNKDKQDFLLSLLENDQIIIIGTTTENPYFCINPAIRSRTHILKLIPPTKEEIYDLLVNVIQENNLNFNIDLLNHIIDISLGDVRNAINLIDMIATLYEPHQINKENIHEIIPHVKIEGSSYGNEFYDLQSAFHKSLRGSDVDASIHYLARLIKIGDLQSIKRRIIAMAYEDVSLANPTLMQRVVVGMQAVELIGLPEAKQILATIVIELCLSPKSNSAYKAISQALDDIDKCGFGNFQIPLHLKDAHYKSAAKLGVTGYKYPHDHKNSWVEQQYLPNEIKNVKYYYPHNNDVEMKLNKISRDWKTKK